MTDLSLYIHVPFCTRRCSYCSFFHVQGGDNETAFVAALEEEIAHAFGELRSPRVRSVFIGGGTPSVLTPGSFERVFASFRPWIASDTTEEITVEINPEDTTPELVAFLKDHGVTRLSLGVQSMDPAAQKVLKRCTPRQNLRAIEIALREYENVSFDVLIGVPGSSLSVFRDTVKSLCSMRPSHFSVYCLERGGDMWQEVDGFFDGVDTERSCEEYLFACEYLRAAGYEHYELSSFALPGRASVHNVVYWNGGDYLGVGPGAHSYMNGRRFHNAPSLEDYLGYRGVRREGRRRYDDSDGVDSALEKMMLGLRTARGIPRGWCVCSDRTLADLEIEGVLTRQDERVRLTDRGFLLLNDVVLKLGKNGITTCLSTKTEEF